MATVFRPSWKRPSSSWIPTDRSRPLLQDEQTPAADEIAPLDVASLAAFLKAAARRDGIPRDDVSELFTEVARRLAKLASAPFVKVEATKFTEVGFVGKDVD